MKGEKMAKRTSLGSIVKKRLSDITNSQFQHKFGDFGEKEKQPEIPVFAEDLINQLLKEKSTLMKLVEERNKIIELSGNELRNLRMNFQKLQLQNWNLAQSNSQITAELNLGREKLKAVQHELVCKDALLKAKNLELEGKADKNGHNSGLQEIENAAGDCLHRTNNGIRSCSRSKRVPARSKSMGASTTHRQAADKEKIENKRRCLRRQSARHRSNINCEFADNLFEIEDAKFSTIRLHENSMQQDGSCVTEEQSSSYERRSSMVGRPLRRAVEKVQSYKEVPINVKMRRAE